MATVHIRSLGVATESVFASISATTGLPDNSGLSFAGLECERASITLDGMSHEMSERVDGRATAYHRPPEPRTMWSGGSRVQRWSGTLNIRAELRTIGSASAFANYTATPLVRLLRSGLGHYVPSTTSDAISAASATANNTRWTPTAIASFPEGAIGCGVKVDVDGRAEFACVTDRIDGGTDYVYASPGFTDDLGAGDGTVWLCDTLYSVLGVSTLGASCAVRLDGDGWRGYAYGGRLESVTASPGEGGKIMLDAVVRFALAQTDHSQASVANPTIADGAIANALGSYVRITGSIGTTSPAELAASSFGADSWSFAITNTLAPRAHSNDLAGMSDLEVVDATATATVTLSVPTSAFDAYFRNQTEVSVMLGAGPTGQGNGAGFYLPAAHLTSDASMRDLGGDLVRQTLNFRAGLWTLDDASAAPADTYARILLPNKT